MLDSLEPLTGHFLWRPQDPLEKAMVEHCFVILLLVVVVKCKSPASELSWHVARGAASRGLTIQVESCGSSGVLTDAALIGCAMSGAVTFK